MVSSSQPAQIADRDPVNFSEVVAHQPPSTWAWYGLFVLVGAMVLSLVNLQLIYVLAEPFKESFSLSDTKMGMLTGLALGLTTAFATYPMGWLSDRVNRQWLLAGCVLIWTIATAACGFAQSYNQLFLGVMGIALGEAVLGPIVYSIIPDLFPENRRVFANYIFFGASILGASLGLALSGGLIATIDALKESHGLFESLETWRLTLMASAVPGPAVALSIVLMKLSRPPQAEDQEKERARILPFARQHWRSLLGVFFGFGLSFSAKSTMFVWAPPALVRLFGEGQAAVGIRLGSITAISSVLGVATSAAAYRFLSKRWRHLAAPRLAQIFLLVGTASLAMLLMTPNTAFAYVILFLFGGAATGAMSLSPTMLQDISPPDIRGRIIALGGLVAVLIGAGTPLLVGVVSDAVDDTGRGLLAAMVGVGVPLLLLSVFCLKFGEKTLHATIQASRKPFGV
ncbi:MAG: MFS transporter [Pseudomonadota bacterium]